MDKVLFANGCSWTAGNGLCRDPLLADHPNSPIDFLLAKEYSWPAVLGQRLSYSVINKAVGGGSNKRILRTTTDYVMNATEEQRQNLLVVIGWSSVERGEIYLHDGPRSDWYRFNSRQPFSNTSQEFQDMSVVREVDKYQQIYLTHMYDRKVNLMYYFQEVFLLANLLENLKIKYLFFNGVVTEFNRTPEEEAEFQLELDKIRKPTMITNTSFVEFCTDRKIPLSPCIHPMTEGHREWANYLHDRLTALYWNQL